MRKVVHKFKIDVVGREFPAGKVVLFGADRSSEICVWIERTEQSEGAQTLVIVGTGQEVPLGHFHVASCKDGTMIWHLYKLEEPAS